MPEDPSETSDSIKRLREIADGLRGLLLPRDAEVLSFSAKLQGRFLQR